VIWRHRTRMRGSRSGRASGPVSIRFVIDNSIGEHRKSACLGCRTRYSRPEAVDAFHVLILVHAGPLLLDAGVAQEPISTGSRQVPPGPEFDFIVQELVVDMHADALIQPGSPGPVL
jgi:hypothetical protein